MLKQTNRKKKIYKNKTRKHRKCRVILTDVGLCLSKAGWVF